MWRNGDTHTLLVGMQMVQPLGKLFSGSLKVKYKFTMQARVSTPNYMPKWNENMST